MRKTTKTTILVSVFSALLLSGCIPAFNKGPTEHSERDRIEPALGSTYEVQTTLISQPERPVSDEQIPNANNLWSRLFKHYNLKDFDHKRVKQERNWYLKHPTYLKRVQERATPYLYYIVTETEKRNMPAELALLPIVESAFQPFAYSHGRAAGIWQFIPSTGRGFGLKQNWWYDGRRDIYASTQAALDYLSNLSKRFDDDWLLALAAYNSGGGTVNKAIRKNREKNKATDYWSLNLPKETRTYVPRLLAIADILANAEMYGIELIDIPNQPQFSAIDTGSQLDLALAAELAGISVKEIYKFNPGFNRWSTDPAGPHRLLIPIEKSVIFKEKLAELPTSKRVKWARHRIRSGETLGHIANKYNTSIAVIKKINSVKGHSIRAGKHLLIPTSSQGLAHYSLSQSQRNLAKLSAKRKGHKQLHTVKSGDTLWDIARSHSISTRQLASWNNMAPRDTLKLGQKLAIWTKGRTSNSNSPINPFKSVNYTVRSGDSLYLIARKFNVSIPELRKWNRKRIGKYLKPGQRLKVNVDITKPTV
jgi:membrane-bound lytic murein transglycosylase D